MEPILRLEPPPTAADKAKEDEGARRLDVRFTGLVFQENHENLQETIDFPHEISAFPADFPIFP